MSSARKVENSWNSKPQNWDKAKKIPNHYLCPIGCDQKIPISEEPIHSEHCPAKKYFMYLRREARRVRDSTDLCDSKKPEIIETGGSDSNLESWDEELKLSEKELHRQNQFKHGKYYFRKLKETAQIDIVSLFLEDMKKKKMIEGGRKLEAKLQLRSEL